MAIYLFTYHAYRSWMPDHRRGYVKQGEVRPPNADEATRYATRASQPENLFDADQQRAMLSLALDFCTRRDLRLFGFAGEPTHVHVLIGWKVFTPWRDVRDRLKNVMALMLGKATNITGRKWFAGKASRKRVRDHKHLNYLLATYLPRHRGLRWRRDDPAPQAIDLLIDELRKHRGLPPAATKKK